MALARSARVASRAAIATRALVGAAPVRGMVTMSDRERAMEAAYFNKEEEQLLRKLLKKVKSQADKADVQAPTHQENERTKLMAIVSKYDMSAADIDALIKWRHADDH